MENVTGKNGYQKKIKVAIIGGGLVGSLAACFFGKQGHDVELYEYREDIRKTPHVKGRTINLSMSLRARTALACVGLEERLHEHGIPMGGRMIHPIKGNQKVSVYDERSKQCIYSVSRRFLNEVLLSATEKYPNVKLIFQHKLANSDLENGKLTFENQVTGEKINVTVDLVVGADGAFSTVRKQMLKMNLFNFSQTYIKHGYLELCIPSTNDQQFAMKPNYLHIWPRGEFMMIALPNQDKTWTVTLFMPFEKFDSLNTPEKLLKFFDTYFPDAVPLLGKEKLIEDFFKVKPQSLVSIKCEPYHVKNKAVLIGDAAHAMVPFYGQGMNAGFEDCRLLDNLMKQYNFDLNKVLPAFSEQRSKDAHAICDLAMYNYVEMRDLVNKPSFIIRKKVDNILYKLFPKMWVPLYNSVTFSDMGYNECIINREWQNQLIKKTFFCVMGASACALAVGLNMWNIFYSEQ